MRSAAPQIRFRVLLPAALAFALLALAPTASADYEQAQTAGNFAHFAADGEAAETTQTASALAVNATGAGGVEAGSFYQVGRRGAVLRFSPGKEGEDPKFQEAWGWAVGLGGPGEQYQRCGPAYRGIANPADHTYEQCRPLASLSSTLGIEQPGAFYLLGGVAVDQNTGNVYVRNTTPASVPPVPRTHHMIEVFTADGEPIGEGFGDLADEFATPPESIAQSPEKLHGVGGGARAPIAVDATGTVYTIDGDFDGVEHHEERVMAFEPCTPGNYESYCYSAGKDIPLGFLGGFQLSLAGADRLVVANEEAMVEYALGAADHSPLCSQPAPGQLRSMTANPITGEVFYFANTDHTIRRFAACDETTGGFREIQKLKPQPVTQTVGAMAVNPTLSWSASRPEGVLYAAAQATFTGGAAVGDILVTAEASPPGITSEFASNTTSASAVLKAAIDPHGFATGYRFQYLSEASYETNEPNERQALTVAATGGLFGLGFQLRAFGGSATANLTTGSKLAEGLVTARGAATLHAGKGTANLVGAVGKGTVIAGSTKVTAASASEGAFGAGQTIVGEGLPTGTVITAVSGSELTLSVAATKSVANTTLKSGTTKLTSLSTSEGSFEVGQQIEGAGIPSGAKVQEVAATSLTISKATEKPGAGVAITAGSEALTGFSTTEGRFEPGGEISGVGIAPGTTITAVHPTALEVSKPPTKPGTGVSISSSGPAPLAVGETIEGPGIPAGTTITAAKAGQLTLSQAAEATQAGAHLQAGLPFDATPAELQAALEALATVGDSNVSVSGGPGDTTGSSPYEVEFRGSLANQDLPALEADASGLSGGPATATVSTTHQGGGGFAGATEVPVGGGEIPGTSPGTASAGIAGLAQDTRYRFRVIASSACEGEGHPPCETVGAPAAFATYPATSAALPDGRAFELVSPAEKHGGEVFPAQPRIYSCLYECKPPGEQITAVFPMQSAPGGNAVAYMGSPFSPGEGAAVFNSYVSTRSSSGWSTVAMSPTLLAAKGGEDLVYNQQLSEGLIQQGSPQLSSDAPAGYDANLYLQHTADPSDLQPLITQSTFESIPPLRAPGSLGVSYWGHSGDFSAQFLAVNDVLTGATPYSPAPPDPGVAGQDLYEWREGRFALVNVLPGNGAVATGASFASASPDAHGSSNDGSRVFWTAAGHLYVRDHGEFSTEIHAPGSFLQASADGSQLLLSDGCLYSLEAESCTDLTEGQGGFEGVVGAGEEAERFSRLYFVDSAALPAAGQNERGQLPLPGKNNLYSWSESGVAFVATLSASDNAGVGPDTLSDWTRDPRDRTAAASPDGRFLAFGSVARLTRYDNVGLCEKVTNSETLLERIPAACREVFFYDSATAELICPSCNPTGEAPLGSSTLRRIDVSRPWSPQPRYLSNAGRLVFDSEDRLSPGDVNGRVEDVYEYEPQGLGSCGRTDGCVSLISPGTGSVDSNLLAVDESGANVFFTSRERLVQKDTDELIDVYDAREGGGFPAESETQRAECQGESCQPVPQAPNDATPASSAFHGAGNVNGGAHKPKKKHKKKHKKNKHKKHEKHKRNAKHNRGGPK